MDFQVKLDKSYPCVVCEHCLQFLNVAYDFKLKFESSQKLLENSLKNCEREDDFLGNDICNIFSNDIIESESSLDNLKECETNEDMEIIYIKYTDFHEDLDLQQSGAESCGDNILDNSSGAFNAVRDKTEKSLKDETTPIKKIRSRRRGRRPSIDVEKFIIERADSDLVTADVKNLSNINDELIRAACNLKYKCSACPKLYSNQRNLEKHEEACKKLKCKVNIQNLFNIKNISVGQDNYSFLYECDKCSQVCSSMEELEHHSETAHNYSNKDNFFNLKAEGLSEIDKELFRSALLLKYQCDSCTKVYSSLERLNRHKTVCRKSKRPKLKKKK